MQSPSEFCNFSVKRFKHDTDLEIIHSISSWCVHVCLCVSVFTCSHLCMWMSGSCVEYLLQSFSTFCFKTISHSTWNSPVQLDWLSSKLHGRGHRCTWRPAFHMGSRGPDSSSQAHVVSVFLSECVSPGCSFDVFLYYVIYYINIV